MSMTDFDQLKLHTGYWYVATPYSKWKGGLDDACHEACLAMGQLVTRGIHAYSPIAHTHPIALASSIDPLSHKIWMKMDKPLFYASFGLLVIALEGWHESKGISMEIKWCRDTRKPMYLIDQSFAGFTPLK